MYYLALEARAPLFAWPVVALSAVFNSYTSCAPGLPAGLRFWHWTVWIYLKFVVTLSRIYIKTFTQHRWATVLPRCFALGRASTTRGSGESFPSFHSRWTQLRQWGRYRAVASYVTAAKDRHIELEYPWSAHLSRAVRRTVRSVLRGRGPAKQAAALDVPALAALRLPFYPVAPRHPLGLRAALATGIMFCMREIELSHLKVKHVKFDASQTVTLYLPLSKTDCAGTGHSRSWGCSCDAAGGAVLCPFHILSAHFHDLCQWFAPVPQDLPVFPSAAGTVAGHGEEISYVAALVGQDLLDTRERRDSLGILSVSLGHAGWRSLGSR